MIPLTSFTWTSKRLFRSAANSFMCATTPHLLNNLARANNCKFEVQGHIDGAFGWCSRDFALLGFGVNSSGIESNWRYMRRDVVGCAGSTQRIALPVFALSLMQYLSIRSMKHADKILCPITGAHKFPSEATYITSKLWKKIQEFKVHRLLLSYCEASQHVRKVWADDMEFFHSCCKNESFGEAIPDLELRD